MRAPAWPDNLPRTAVRPPLAPFLLLGAALIGAIIPSGALFAQGVPGPGDSQVVHELTLENMVDLVMRTSFTVRRLKLEVERDQLNLQSQRARLRSSADLELLSPAFRLTSEPRWNSTLQKDEIIREHTRRWEGEISIRQPVILFGWPTNGYLSINNRMYQYTQFEDDGTQEIDYYNRYFISYSQPLFQPNGLKNSLEQAELSLESTQIEFNRDILEIVSGVSEAYHDLLEEHHLRRLRQELVAQLERALDIGRRLAQTDSARTMEVDQIQVELANAQERLRSQESSIRLAFAEVKQELGLNDTDSVAFEPIFQLDPVAVDMDEAVRFALELTPTLRQFEIGLRNQEISLERTKNRGAFRLNLDMSYGRERQDAYFNRLWQDPENSYTINVSAYLPIFDGGERKARIAAGEIAIEQTQLYLEQTQIGIVSTVRNEVLNVRDRENRTLAMQENVNLAREISAANFQRYEAGGITAQELILSLLREADTNENFLDSYVSWKESLRRLQTQTYYDFERNRPFLEVLREEGWIPENGIEGLRP